jgi:N4-bis(aminopropyl)spermidine synthase
VAKSEFDLHGALNAISDVVQNRPPPLREFDQIYMKAGDMVLQSEYVAHWADGKRLAFIGDGDAISICSMYLRHRDIVDYGPASVTVFDFDERICNAIRRFADAERLDNLDAHLYNCLDPFPRAGEFDCFYTNPPWGASNGGHSVSVFMQRGFEAVSYGGDGLVVVADDPDLTWPKEVLAHLQAYAIDRGYFVQRMMSQVHSYHLDDAPDLKSCNVLVRACSDHAAQVAERGPSEAIRDEVILTNFYGRGAGPRVRYVLEKERLNYGKAHDSEYLLDLLEAASE